MFRKPLIAAAVAVAALTGAAGLGTAQAETYHHHRIVHHYYASEPSPYYTSYYGPYYGPGYGYGYAPAPVAIVPGAVCLAFSLIGGC